VFSTHHRIVGLWYFAAASVFLLVGFLLMLLMRWQLAWPTSPLPPAFTAIVGQTNAPGGYMAPEFYNQLVAMHGTVMIFLAVVPLLTGAFAHYLVPLQIGAGGLAFPRLSFAALLLYVAAGVLMLLGFFTEGGAANSGWTSYPPLSVLATRGQSFWLVGMLLLGVSVMLAAINMIVTIVQLRAPGLRFMQLPFFVWSQLVAALLLLLAFPALQAAGILQLLDRVAGTSFFMPTGLVVSGIPVQDFSGGGNPLLWQHLFWFLGHPEVYVLILPAIGIVSEIISHGTGRPLWGYRGMVAAVLFLGLMSMLVWAHHMFLTGMGTTMGAFFQVTTMIVSIPSVVLVTSLVLSLWGGSIRFTPAMLFALAFIPMFGFGGLSGLPLGLAASNVMLHDTWYVVGHFHFIVAPGTIFAIFAGIYYWFPTVTGRTLNARLGQLHFWGSLIAMTGIFLPMFTLGLRGVNRRLYDAGLQYTHAQGTLGVQEHMTWMALALAGAQVPLVVNAVLTLRGQVTNSQVEVEGQVTNSQVGGAADGAAARAQAAPVQRSNGVAPWTYSRHPDSRVTNVAMATWLWLASLTMLFGSLFSAYVLLRTGAREWPDVWQWLSPVRLAVLTILIALPAAISPILARGLFAPRGGQCPRPAVRWALLIGGLSAVGFVALQWISLQQLLDAGIRPSDSLAIACWFLLTGAHAALTFATAGAHLWSVHTLHRTGAAERLRGLALCWFFINLVWLAILAAFWR
jgi:cytochrome c oxidase subunit I